MLGLPRLVLVLGLVSLANDAASEMIAPLLPLYLTATLGAGPAVVGLVEGVAEATASVLKLASGWLADRGVPAKPLIVGGYTLSNAARPLIGVALGWPFVLGLRFLDRVGKGLRTSPRDALIAERTHEARRGRAFGVARALDHAGSVIGPLVAFALLRSGAPLGRVFVLSLVPGALAVALAAWGLSGEKSPAAASEARSEPKASGDHPAGWRALHPELRALLVAAGVLALATVPEAFLVLWASAAGLDVVWVPLLWAAASLGKAVIAVPAGALSDQLGKSRVLALGWGARVTLLLALALLPARGASVWLLFLGFAASLAATEPGERSLIGDRAAPEERGTAFGLFHLLAGVLALPGAFLFGALWQAAGSRTAFLAAAALTAGAAASMGAIARRSTRA